MKPSPSLLGLCAILALLVAACGGDAGDGFSVPEGCNPLAADWHCSLPYPSDFFLVEDPSTESGKRVELTEAARPLRNNDVRAELFDAAVADGYSPGSQILALFPYAVDDSNLRGFGDDVRTAAEPDAATIVIDAETGRWIPHIAELDVRVESKVDRVLAIRPLVRLENGKRYIVAIQNLVTDEGDAVPAPKGFRLLRDGDAKGKDGIGDLVAHYEDAVFPVLEGKAGVERSKLQLAWDFTVRTQVDATRDLDAIRADVLATFKTKAPKVEITKVTDSAKGALARLVEGTIEVPLYMDSDEPGASLLRDGDGNIKSEGTAAVPFVAVIPRSVMERGPEDPPARVIQYGHGIFGSRTEASEKGSWIPEFADTYGFVVVAADWWGMSDKDLGSILTDLGDDPSNTMRFTERVHQAMANQLALGEAVMRSFPELDDFKVDDVLTYDPEHLYFYGNSLGHIFGGTYVGLSPHVERAVLGVGGADFTHFIVRSSAFGQFFLVLDTMYDNPVDVQFFLAMTQNAFDHVDPLNYAPSVYDPYDGAVDRTYLVQMGLGDATVPNIATYFHARLLDLPILGPAPADAPLLEVEKGPIEGSALAIYDFGIDPLPGLKPEASPTNAVHDSVRRADATQQQIDAFLKPAGKVQYFCDAPCTLELQE